MSPSMLLTRLQARTLLMAQYIAKDSDNMPNQTTPSSQFGSDSSSTGFASLFPFSAGLKGVDQQGNFLFAHILVGTFCFVIAFTLFLRWAKMFMNYLRRICIIANPSRQSFWSLNGTKWWPWLKEHFMYAPLWRTRHNREFSFRRGAISMGTLPSRGHMILLVTYGLCNLAYTLVLPYDKSFVTNMAALRGRAGVLAALNMIPTTLFALRNNPLIWILEVPFDTFNLLHRWLARIFILESVVHAVAWFIVTYHVGGLEGIKLGFGQMPRGPSYVWATFATAAAILISIQAWSPLRHAAYETFLNFHRLLLIMMIVGIYKHLQISHLPQIPWVEASFSIWVLEYAARALRIIYHNISVKRGFTQVTVEALPAEACRITFMLTRPWKTRAGAHAHIYIPAVGWWSSHPFSVAWTDIHPVVPLGPLEKDPEKLQAEYEPEMEFREGEMMAHVSFVVRARTGFTRRLHDKAIKSPEGVYSSWGLVEGPYGGLDNLSSYGTLLMFAGGVGITHQISYIRELIQGYSSGVTGTRKIVLVWSIPNTEALEWVRPWMDEILRMRGRREVLKILLFVTRPRNNREVQSGSGSVQMFPGRCNPQTVLDKEILGRQGAMAVTVCGPGGFADDVRAAVRKRVKVGVVDLVEEAFTY